MFHNLQRALLQFWARGSTWCQDTGIEIKILRSATAVPDLGYGMHPSHRCSLWYCPVTSLRWLFSSTTGSRGGASIYLFCLHINEVIFAPGRAFPWDLTGFKGRLKSMQGFYHVFRTHQNDLLWKTWIVEYETAAQSWLVLSAIP